jgi:iron complex outermembrane receptor protein
MTTNAHRRRTASAFLFLSAAVAASPALAHAADVTLAGSVRGLEGRPLAGAMIVVDNGARTAQADSAGMWRLVVPSGTVSLEARRPGYRAARLEVHADADRSGLDFTLDPLYRLSEEVVVQAVRADADAPVTKTDLGHADIDRLNYGQEMPFLLKDLPSVTQYSDTGTGSGYAYLYLRGIPQTRLNITLDGVPLNEPEDSALYFVDFGDFASSLESIQVQRGVGTSSVGTAPYAGSVNFASLDLGDEASLLGRLELGSFATTRASLGGESGRIGPGLRLYARGSYQDTDGFRDRSGVTQKSVFYGASRQDDHSFLKVFGFVGREETQLAFLATEEAVLQEDLRFNPMAPEERDRFGQQFAQAQYTRFLGPGTSLAGQVYYNWAGGWYRIWADADHSQLYQYDLDWHFGGGLATFRHVKGPLDFTAGTHVNGFESDHARDVVDVGPQYLNHGHKNEQSGFAKLGYDLGRVRVYGDVQLRHSSFRYEGDVPLGSVDWTFFNPKAGVRFAASPSLSLYASVGRAGREPARSDMLAGEDNATIVYDLHAVKPEKVVDFEAGLEVRTPRLTLGLTAFAMEFRNEIAQTGELSEIGLPLRRNVDKSSRRGLELDLLWRPRPTLGVRLSASANRSRIDRWTQFYDVYDADGNWVSSTSRDFSDVPPLLTPGFVAQPAVEYAPARWLTLTAAGRYVSTSHLDNTGDDGFRTPDFFGLDAGARVSLERWIKKGKPRLSVRVLNVFDNRRIWPSGYSYQYFNEDASGVLQPAGISYFYPQATRSVFVSLDFGR